MIKQGCVVVNGEVEKVFGYQIEEGDVVIFDGKIIQLEECKVYILMNKFKDVIIILRDECG